MMPKDSRIQGISIHRRSSSTGKRQRQKSQRLMSLRSSPSSSSSPNHDNDNDNSSGRSGTSNNKIKFKKKKKGGNNSKTNKHNNRNDILDSTDDEIKFNLNQVNDLVNNIRKVLVDNSDIEYQKWITNYMKDTIPYVGCKAPIVEQTVKNVMKACGYSMPKKQRKKEKKSKAATKKRKLDDCNNNSNNNKVEEHHAMKQNQQIIIDAGFTLLKEPEGDVKIAGMVLLSEYLPLTTSYETSKLILERLENEIFTPKEHDMDDDSGAGRYVNEWATTDALSMRILKRIALQSSCEDNQNHAELTYRILNYSITGKTIWHRRCGLIPFLTYRNHLADGILPNDFSMKLVDSIEESLQLSPNERFTQTACAWLLRYTILEDSQDTCEYALQMILRNRELWTTEAKRSIAKRLETDDPRKKQILEM